ncbi:MAG: AI-2E family transporter [Haloarculaceae archaeon]
MSLTRRQQVLGGLFVATAALTLLMLRRVLATVFFAITIAYVLYPVRRRLARYGLGRRSASAAAALVGLVTAVALVGPLVYVLYARRDALLDLLDAVPDTLTISAFGFTYTENISDLLAQAQSAVVTVAVDVASALPVIALKGFLFVFLVYALLLGGENLGGAMARLVPGEYHDVVLALHQRVRDTLYALYVLQAATAFVTFLMGLAVFTLLGYKSVFSLSILSGILQFIPILGPSIVIVAIGAFEVLPGNVTQAVLVVAIGLVVIGFLPDALIRPRLASLTTGMPASLYFVGFTGGTLSLGVVGVIAGPLAVAVLVEVTELVTRERNGIQTRLDERGFEPPPDEEASPALEAEE